MLRLSTLKKNLTRTFSIFCLLILVAQQFNTAVYALDPCQKNVYDSGVHYFDCSNSANGCSNGGSVVGGSASAYTPISTNTYSAGDEFSFLVGKGLSPITAAAITGNAIWESGGSSTALTIVTDNPSSVGANGIHQWYQGRLTALQNLAQKEKVSWSDLGVQLDYLWLEFTNGPGAGADESGPLAAVKAQTDIASAATTFEAKFEVSGDTGSYPYRIANAQAVLAKFGGGGVSTTTTQTTGCSTSTGGAVGGFTNPFPGGWIPNRLDMGYDGTFKGQIVAPCDGTVTYAGPFNGWNGSSGVIIKCKNDIGFPVHSLYFTEGVGPITSLQGQDVKAGTPIANAVPSPYGAYVGTSVGAIEWGLSQDGPIGTQVNTYAQQIGFSGKCSPSAASRAMVLKFYQWVQQTLQVPGNTTNETCAGAS